VSFFTWFREKRRVGKRHHQVYFPILFRASPASRSSRKGMMEVLRLFPIFREITLYFKEQT
jgi:hypothetical protein